MFELAFSPELLLLLFVTGTLAGLVDSMAGGGGLIALPMLLSTGISPIEALATNKLQGSFGTLSSTLYFVRKGYLNLRKIWFQIICTFIGSVTGTLVVQNTDPGLIISIAPLLLITVALYFWLVPSVHEEDAKRRIGSNLFALSVGFGVGFYDGFFGPGAGAFFAAAYVYLLGFSLLQATAHTKVLNFTSNIASLLFFMIGGHIIWTLGLTMAAGQFIGGRIGARLAIRKGARLIRPVIVTVSVIISIKLAMAENGLFQHLSALFL
ncbi:MAG: TSUP family transporter [Gammaproteobacteria bacterium]|nr:TSUP family transporter [Gammaproteobacteria bacterium]